MLNSRNYQSDANILNSGEEIVTSIEELNDPNAKTYHHYVKNSVTHLPDGAQITFRGGVFVTANPEIQAFLDKIADKRGSMVFTKKDSEDKAKQEIQHVALAAMVQPGDQGKKSEDGTMEADLTKSLDPSTLVSETEKTSPALLLKPGAGLARKP